jgi:hypothetical protein
MGKISVKHYLNKKVKPSDDPEFADDPEYADLPEYPIYYYITINRKTIHKPSKIHICLNDKLFSKGVTRMGMGNTIELMKYESKMITKACELFLKDYETGKVNSKYILLSRRGFKAKDIFVNGLNSYIEFYTQSIYTLVCDYTRKEINSYLVNKLEKALDLSMCKKGAVSNVEITINTDNLFTNVELEFYRRNLDNERMNLYYLEKCMYNCLAATNMKYGYDLPLVEWLYGDLKDTILNTITRKKEDDRLQIFCENSGFNKDYFEKHFEPIINKLVTLEFQVEQIFGRH